MRLLPRGQAPYAALGYAATFGLASATVAARPATERDAWLAYLGTNLANLADHPLRSLVGAAFVTDDANVLGWTALRWSASPPPVGRWVSSG